MDGTVGTEPSNGHGTGTAGLLLVGAIVLFQLYTTYRAYRAGGVEAIAVDVVFLYLTIALLIGIATDTVRSVAFNALFSAGGVVVHVIAYVLDPGPMKLVVGSVMALGLLYYASEWSR